MRDPGSLGLVCKHYHVPHRTTNIIFAQNTNAQGLGGIGAFFRVGFWGALPSELKGLEFVYRVPLMTHVSDFQNRVLKLIHPLVSDPAKVCALRDIPLFFFFFHTFCWARKKVRVHRRGRLCMLEEERVQVLDKPKINFLYSRLWHRQTEKLVRARVLCQRVRNGFDRQFCCFAVRVLFVLWFGVCVSFGRRTIACNHAIHLPVLLFFQVYLPQRGHRKHRSVLCRACLLGGHGPSPLCTSIVFHCIVAVSPVFHHIYRLIFFFAQLLLNSRIPDRLFLLAGQGAARLCRRGPRYRRDSRVRQDHFRKAGKNHRCMSVTIDRSGCVSLLSPLVSVCFNVSVGFARNPRVVALLGPALCGCSLFRLVPSLLGKERKHAHPAPRKSSLLIPLV